jgi:ParB-like chromosome segregation protein Spo0J
MSQPEEIIYCHINDLNPATYNPRIEMPEHEMNALKKSMNEFGCCEPIVVNKRTDHTVVGGHQRIIAAKALGWERIPCIFVDLDSIKEKALNLALNKIHGEWDYDKLKIVLEELHIQDDLDFEVTGFDEYEFEALKARLDEDAEMSDIKELDDPDSGMNFIIKCRDLKELTQVKQFFGTSGQKVRFDSAWDRLNRSES